ncbi:hypothetical protein CLV62_12541 [Dysgonomonas alginatilytica]|uniref:Uncharacterized protein n=1 Tax=Dysgonomonas alginatilytica TaxID=1605892 RepID=A0A2V3PM85_9BACT|nr:hypothetical protein [Dysgonomonas alginatilytica]PXV61208.1 hypothetical protein CLV62_12541 [Dysgonomonas alginatilytica]
MSDKKETTEISQLAGTEVRFWIPNTEELGVLEGLDPKRSLTLKYKTQDDWAAIKGQPIRAYYMGIREIPNEDGELIKCGVFVTATENFISGQKVLVEAISSLDSKTPVEITYLDKSKNKSTDGSTMRFEVKVLG